MDAEFFLRNAMMAIPLLLSLTVHEYAHAWSAWRLGDDTAQMQGRLTLNPVVHIDPIGTLLLPLLGVPFGWAKPVPVNPARFRRDVNMSTGMMLTAAAGPLSNVLLAVLSAVALGVMFRWLPGHLSPALHFLLSITIVMNVGLALFNLLPIPPLDGSRVVEGLLPYRMRGAWERFMQLSPFLLLFVLFFGGRLIAGPRSYITSWLDQLVFGIATSG